MCQRVVGWGVEGKVDLRDGERQFLSRGSALVRLSSAVT